MAEVRFVALVLAVALTGPSVGAVVCEIACAAEHSPAPVASSCHDTAGPASLPTVAAGHACHDVTTPELSIAAAASQSDTRIAAEAVTPVIGLRAPSPERTAAPPLHARPHAPPLIALVSLRI